MSLSERAPDDTTSLPSSIVPVTFDADLDVDGDTDLEVTVVARRVRRPDDEPLDREELDRLPEPVGSPRIPATPSRAAGSGDVYPVPYPSPWLTETHDSPDADAAVPRRPLLSRNFVVTALLGIGITFFSLGLFLLTVVL